MQKIILVVCLATLTAAAFAKAPALPQHDAARADVLKKAYRFQRESWTYVHLEGSPYEVGYEHGSLLAKEIGDAFNAERVLSTHDAKRDWKFFRESAQKMLWPHTDPEYQLEMMGIADGVKDKGVNLDLWDIVAYNASMEVPGYYVPWLDAKQHKPVPNDVKTPAERCSAFVATGSWTTDGKPVIAHNNWTSYIDGARWRVIMDIAPEKGHKLIQDGLPGIIVSDDDFGINDAGLIVTETTISNFSGWDPNGKPEFVRARKALQYADNIDDYVKIMLDGNNGGYANDWLLADRNTGEIARFELGLKHHQLWKSSDGYYVGSNFASDPALIKDEAPFDLTDMSKSQNARRARWEQLMAENKGKIDVAMAEGFLADHYDSFEKKVQPSDRTLCGHNEDSPRGMGGGWNAYYPAGSAIAQAADARMAGNMEMAAQAGHSCQQDFKAAPFLAAHPQFNWQKPVLIDMTGEKWATFKADEAASKPEK
ncbi:MAG: C45 family peptidase [Acidobacteriaceae bacterium]